MAPGGGMPPGGNGGRAVKELVRIGRENKRPHTERARWRTTKADGGWNKSRRSY